MENKLLNKDSNGLSNGNNYNNKKQSYSSDYFRNKNQNGNGDIWNWIKNFIKKNLLVVLIVTGALIGLIIGLSINDAVQKLGQPARYNVIITIGFPGELLLRMLKMLILPLITFSLITGLAGLNGKVSGKIGARAIAYYMTTTCIAAIIGLILVSAIRPGSAMVPPKDSEPQKDVRPLDSFMDIVRNMFPSNIVKACVQQDKTKIKFINGTLLSEDKVSFDVTRFSEAAITDMVNKKEIFESPGSSPSTPLNKRSFYKKVKNYSKPKIGDGLEQTGNANFLGLIVFAMAVGKIAGSMGKEAEMFLAFITTFNAIVTRLIVLVMWYSPIGIGSLIMARFAEMENIHETFAGLALFIVTVILGIGIHGLIVLPAIFFFFTRTNPYVYLSRVGPAMATAFGTDSSAATLPTTFRCLEENLKIDKRITRFILPVGTTINMDGTALYEAVSAIFIAQSVGQSLSFGDYIAISFTSILASVGAAAIPHAGLVTMLIVLDTVGLPTDMIAIIFSVDWFLDRVRTMINVLGDAYGAGIVQHLSKDDLAKADLIEKAKLERKAEEQGNYRTLKDDEGDEVSFEDEMNSSKSSQVTTYC
ncbi:excitatory amino acid transporter-like [Clytia hemisphaerica]|uniref:Amino acid transporter n=1 Tax=Clytia hemisphaerica TaxID=252671 RepID=A0A7M5V574_9CNID